MIEFTLEKTLNELEITVYRLSKVSKINPHTIHRIAKNEAQMLDVQKIDILIDSLNEIAIDKGFNRIYGIEDVLIHKSNVRDND
ncbi:hypothetical protein LC087_18785 (plasmid) [Bacillus carboniphilus]|uniref:HTH cro/C1-type domain-containing protein n=1 Tax=Bacillus carboniphilus TaxID=86663 RepID=A0ABY9K160_9BACI|nr:hypothetical protein [Bacillus carboniphilus]WLR44430.1 hypothetical protein LC087_18785 [Bacillus carboniphilus]